MIGDNLPHHIQSAEDACAFAATIAAIRATVEAIEAEHKPQLDYLKEQADACRAERDERTGPLEAKAEGLRKVLADYLSADPDGTLKDGARVVAVLTKKLGKPVADPDKVPDAYKSLQPDMQKIAVALAAGEKIPGVLVPVTKTLRVMG